MPQPPTPLPTPQPTVFGYGHAYCLANGLCWFDGILSRGSCTDKNWAAPSCAQWCQEEQRNTSMNIFPCHRQGVWQCEWHDDCAANFQAAPSRLRAGTKAGIAVGVVVSGALAVSGTFFYFGFFCRQHRSVHWNMHPVSDKSELAGQPAAVELDPTGVEPELTAQTPRWEMESGRETCE